jgi:hypothetical protein
MQQTIEINNIRNLLDKVNILTKKHEEIAAITGDDFNIFRILGVNFKETVYSRIIWGLLNPKGLHRQGSLYLDLFIDEIINTINNIDDSAENEIDFSSLIVKIESLKSINTTVIKEDYLGEVDLKNETGGFIDIMISNGSFSLAIENKINASDQPKQLLRYKNSNNVILYLTKFGIAPSEGSTGSLIENEDYFCISYSETIKNWIEKCIQASIGLPKVRETLQQFHNSINIITMSISNKLNDEIISEILKNDDSLKSFLYISKHGESIKKECLYSNVSDIVNFIKTDLHFNEVNYKLTQSKYPHIGFKNEKLNKLGVNLTLQFNNTNEDFSKFIIGYSWVDSNIKLDSTYKILEDVKGELVHLKLTFFKSNSYLIYFFVPEYKDKSLINDKFEDFTNGKFKSVTMKYMSLLNNALLKVLDKYE